MSRNIRALAMKIGATTIFIMGERTTRGVYGRGDNELAIAGGFNNIDEYWNAVLSMELKVSKFIELLEGPNQSPEQMAKEINGQFPSIASFLRSALAEAFDNNEPWFIQPRSSNGTLELLKVRPREAVQWLLDRPVHRDLVPESLRGMIEGTAQPTTTKGAPVITPRKRGPKPAELERVVKALRLLIEKKGPSYLNEKQVVLAAELNTSRKTLSTALDRINDESA